MWQCYKLQATRSRSRSRTRTPKPQALCFLLLLLARSISSQKRRGVMGLSGRHSVGRAAGWAAMCIPAFQRLNNNRGHVCIFAHLIHHTLHTQKTHTMRSVWLFLVASVRASAFWTWPPPDFFQHPDADATNYTRHADTHILQLSTLSSRYCLPWIRLFDPTIPAFDVRGAMPSSRWRRTEDFRNLFSGAKLAMILTPLNCAFLDSLTRTSFERRLATLASWVDHRVLDRTTLAFQNLPPVQRSLREVLSSVRRSLYLLFFRADYEDFRNALHALCNTYRANLAIYLDGPGTDQLLTHYHAVVSAAATYRDQIATDLDYIALQITLCHRNTDSEPSCREQWRAEIRQLHQNKAYVDWQELNTLVTYQRYTAMRFFARQMRDILDILLVRMQTHPNDFEVIKDLIICLQYIGRSSSAGPTQLHALGDRAALYASQHWAHHHADTPRPPPPPPPSYSWPITDTIKCLVNLRNAWRISTTISQSFPSLPPDFRKPDRYALPDVLTCPNVLTLMRSHHWVHRYLSSLELCDEVTDVPNDHRIAVPLPREPTAADWNCEAPSWGAEPAELSGKGLRMGNTPYGKKRDWRAFKRASHGKSELNPLWERSWMNGAWSSRGITMSCHKIGRKDGESEACNHAKGEWTLGSIGRTECRGESDRSNQVVAVTPTCMLRSRSNNPFHPALVRPNKDLGATTKVGANALY
ncbi:uncharacterized protein MYCFIDRAFT_180108 [Pseudocercospora fijiensis CIRAD86]|uniref:Uncharacterized protein n=1 Tax=Pseudocercospora fijiensis (strain CIRAD86) TaxID=383855 RepID=M2YHB8_PSEFD|nr:uncharacterized protein MYCFIDRAFT_180108 [Pseudocercospora fijiensis CIRAD86]EME77215.1 hypothetical protein MYCFIDRAFT_180108 [Pseudocercospora fijiensis CIRAD86]